jgi:hypothetical protein
MKMFRVAQGVAATQRRTGSLDRSAGRRCLMGFLVMSFALTACGDAGGDAEASTSELLKNVLTPEEEAAGWVLLFNGENTDGWRGWNMESFPETGWTVLDGDLVVFASDGSEAGLGGDIVSEGVYADFELVFDFKVSPVGNSGVFYRVVEHAGQDMWHVAPEYQILDDEDYIENGIIDEYKHRTAFNYDLQRSTVVASNPIGEWNHARILVDGAHVEHWLNDQLTVSYEFWSPEWEALVAESKFAPYPMYGRAAEGRIGIQDHGHEIRFKNIKLRPLGDG